MWQEKAEAEVVKLEDGLLLGSPKTGKRSGLSYRVMVVCLLSGLITKNFAPQNDNSLRCSFYTRSS